MRIEQLAHNTAFCCTGLRLRFGQGTRNFLEVLFELAEVACKTSRKVENVCKSLGKLNCRVSLCGV